MDLKDPYYEIFKKDKNVFVSKIYNLISVFDSVFYSRNDYEVLSPNQRNYIVKKLLENGHKQLSGSKLQNLETKVFLNFPPTLSLGVSPIRGLQYTYNENQILILTPGGLFLYLLSEMNVGNKPRFIDEMKELVSKQPINLKQIEDFTVNEPFENQFLSIKKEITEIQKNAIETSLKHRKSL